MKAHIDPQNLQISYIGGGSRGWAWGLMKDLAMDGDMCGTVRLYDIDMQAAKNNELIGNRLSENPKVKSRWHYEAVPTLQAVLTGAHFVIISILPGTFEEMRSDVHAPEQYGIYQSVGDTIGLGGLMRAMRTIPMFVTIATAIRDYAPDAWVINYTNPLTLCVRTLYEVFPAVKAFGCCHEVFGTQGLLCTMLDKEYGIQGVQRQDLYTTVTGINHFTWLQSASYHGMDLIPLYSAFTDKYHKTGFEEGQDHNWMNNSFACAHRVKFDLFRRYGLIAAAGDRHLAEFTPQTYLTSPDTVHQWMFGLTSVDWRIQDLHTRLNRAVRLVSGEEDMGLDGSGEEGHLLMKALLGMGKLVSNVNLPNRGQIATLPLGAVVETNALFTRDSIEPLLTPAMPSELNALILRHVLNQENILKAALTCDRDLAFDTFMNDPQMTLDRKQGKLLFDTMLENQKTYLPAQWFA